MVDYSYSQGTEAAWELRGPRNTTVGSVAGRRIENTSASSLRFTSLTKIDLIIVYWCGLDVSPAKHRDRAQMRSMASFRRQDSCYSTRVACNNCMLLFRVLTLTTSVTDILMMLDISHSI